MHSNSIHSTNTPQVCNMNNPVQAEGAARGRKSTRTLYNPAGVEHQHFTMVAYLAARCFIRMLFLPRAAFAVGELARGYYLFNAFGVFRALLLCRFFYNLRPKYLHNTHLTFRI